jgi:ornithine cyclodeaminase/alanine dehydrogenase-like protein (mu-crystallin family)
MAIVITDADVRRLMGYDDCIESMRVAFKDFAEGSAVNRPRMRYTCRHSDPARRYFANVHVGAVPSVGVACVRAGSQILVPPSKDNDRRLYDSPSQFNWGIVILYSTETAEPLALMHEFELSGMRVGATNGLAIDVMAREDASRLALFGTGKQARSALEAALRVRPFREVVVYSPNADHLSSFVKEVGRQGITVRAAKGPREAIGGADVVLCCTSSMKPVVEGDWLEDGQMIVTIANSDVTNKRSEVDRRVFERSSAVIVADWESVVDNDQTELLEPIEAGALAQEAVHTLGDLVAGKSAVRQLPRGQGKGVIYFKNNSGLAIQFAAPGAFLHRKLKAEGGAREIPNEWLGTDLSALYAAGYRPSP